MADYRVKRWSRLDTFCIKTVMFVGLATCVGIMGGSLIVILYAVGVFMSGLFK